MKYEEVYKSALSYYIESCIANIPKESSGLKCVEIPKDGKYKRRERRKGRL